MAEQDGGSDPYQVVRNGENQHSVWPADRPLPPGWTAIGFTGAKHACLQHVETVWTDLLPASVRRRLEQPAGA